MKKPKQPDRLSRMVWGHKDLLDYGPRGYWLHADKVVNLLCREHRAVVRMVRGSMYISKNALLTRDQRIEQDVYRDILAKLKARGQ